MSEQDDYARYMADKEDYEHRSEINELYQELSAVKAERDKLKAKLGIYARGTIYANHIIDSQRADNAKLTETILALRAENEKLNHLVSEADKLTQKFIDKYDKGFIRSVETIKDCRDFQKLKEDSK